jgi:hypothetical protein
MKSPKISSAERWLHIIISEAAILWVELSGLKNHIIACGTKRGLVYFYIQSAMRAAIVSCVSWNGKLYLNKERIERQIWVRRAALEAMHFISCALLCKHITGERALLDRKEKKSRGIAYSQGEL